MTAGDWRALYEAQGGLCALCTISLDTVKACVDHCHSTGLVRGILCDRCNVGLGFLEPSLEAFLQRVEQYLLGGV